MSDSLHLPLVRVPASPEVVLAERHAALCTAYREGRTPEVNLPSIYRLARTVVARGHLELYRARG